ncbi:hypothetical protein [Streptomyces sp. NPDC088246]|uniref:hypothetical protein n=1 Tax=Streptomyces sp. NPDC088246 TaxID=3365842 RepID=UPI0037F62037
MFAEIAQELDRSPAESHLPLRHLDSAPRRHNNSARPSLDWSTKPRRTPEISPSTTY